MARTAIGRIRGETVGRALAGGGSQLLSVGTEVVNRALGVPGLVANLSGFGQRKRMRVSAVVLSVPAVGDGVAWAPARNGESGPRGAARGRRDLQARGEHGGVLGRVAEDPHDRGAGARLRPERRLWQRLVGARPRRGGGLLPRQAVGCAKRIRSSARAVTGYGEPIAVFVVRDIAGKGGCSLGPLSDYVTVDRARGRLIAHELGHSCGLWHAKEAGNLMLPAADSESMTRSQQAIFRNSRHVTFR